MVSGDVASYDVTAQSTAPPAKVFALLADAPGWSRWAGPMVVRSWWEREGEPPPGGVGAIRRLGIGALSSREEIVEYDAPRRLAYTWLTSFPVRDYRADVRLEPDGTGTRIVWSGTFTPAFPGGAAVMRRFFLSTVGGFARRLAAEAERTS
ncbi:MAG TPA: SRPBCC family protein [Mycobacteriales bacterium]|nr:SRPBCC family protein [Mycobacteriales bacterium]